GFRSMDPPFFVFTAVNRDVSWRVFHVFDDGGLSVFAATDIVPEDNRDSLKIIAEDATLAGYVRAWRKPGWLAPQSSPHENRWFGFNPVPEEYDWADQVSGPVKTRYYIDAVSGADAADALPVKRPEIANNHLDYMLTWYGLALALLVIYGILHQREGRLTLTWK
ncbi:MAG: hypothetical protein GDA39_00240, partial [Hyphomonadaceae bacterium]|nr:hypothetical protein [Hyphomonadaceae bacterium]